MPQKSIFQFIRPALLCSFALFLSGCGFLSGAEPTATPSPEPRALVPTFTPTPLLATNTPVPPPPTATPVANVPATDTPAPAPEEPTATDTPAPTNARLTVTNAVANVRRGPGTNYGIVGSVSQGMQFDVIGKNPAGDWFQFCCVNGEQGWIFGSLVQVENPQLVALAQNIPAPPPTNTPPPAPPPATNTPPPAPAPPPAADPCAGIGGDGCKFKVRGGPAFTNNGGGELKLTLGFVHSGRNNEPQSSYFVVLLKDGVNLGVPDSVRSFSPARSGPKGQYNYEYKISLDRLPGNTVAGNYTIWVLDGNGERDSQNFNFTVPEGQGEVWINFDQA